MVQEVLWIRMDEQATDEIARLVGFVASDLNLHLESDHEVSLPKHHHHAIVVAGPHHADALNHARRIHRDLPDAYIIILTDPQAERELRHQTRIAPMLGELWTITCTDSDSLLKAMQHGLGVLRQREDLRSVLNRANQELVRSARTNQNTLHALFRSDRFLAHFLDQASDAIIATDSDGNITRWNRAAERIFHSSAPEVLGRPLAQSTGGDWPKEIARLMELLSSSDSVHADHVDCSAPDGSSLVASLSIGAVHDDADECLGLSVIARDVTEQENMRRRMIEYTQQLEKFNIELNHFVQAASHDLQEPLRTIIGFSSMLEEKYVAALDSNGRDWLDRITRAGKRMHALIDDLLTYMHVDAKDQAFTSLNLKDVVAAAIENLAISIQESRAQIIIDPLPVIRGDRNQMIRVFQNLIGNALKFTKPKTSPQIHIRASESEMHWLVSVEDSGIGIPSHQIDRVFGLFVRLHDRAMFPGNGMGLATCRLILERHGGSIEVVSSPNQGATFTFLIPK